MKREDTNRFEELGGQMSFLEHLDEFRKRLVSSLIVVGLAFILCFYFSDKIYNFLAIPVTNALTEAQRKQIKEEGQTGVEKIQRIKNLKDGEKGKFVFDRATNIGVTFVPQGTSVEAIVARDEKGNLTLFTNEKILTATSVIPKGIKLPVDLNPDNVTEEDSKERMIVTTAPESFTLYVTVSLYSAIALSIPFLLLQIWGFISPALYKHEKKYVTPFILLSTSSFVLGSAFAYYILLPPALSFLLGLGKDFQLLLRATDYFDFVTLIMLAMGLIFQMPAITYVLAKIGIVSAGFLIRTWKIALVIILIAAAFISPTGDIPNMLLFAAPMVALYLVSIFVAWIFGKKRNREEDEVF